MDVEQERQFLTRVGVFGQEDAGGDSGFRRDYDVFGSDPGWGIVGRGNFHSRPRSVYMYTAIFVCFKKAAVIQYFFIVTGFHFVVHKRSDDAVCLRELDLFRMR